MIITKKTLNSEEAATRQYRAVSGEKVVMGKKVVKMKRLEHQLSKHKKKEQNTYNNTDMRLAILSPKNVLC